MCSGSCSWTESSTPWGSPACTTSMNTGAIIEGRSDNYIKHIICWCTCPHHCCEYVTTVWNPHFEKHIGKIEKVHRAVIILPNEPRLNKLPLAALREKRKGNMIMLYKCVKGKKKIDINVWIRRSGGYSAMTIPLWDDSGGNETIE